MVVDVICKCFDLLGILLLGATTINIYLYHGLASMTKLGVRKNLVKACTVAVLGIVAAGAVTTAKAQAVVITFDELGSGSGLIADGYQELNWDNFAFLDSTNYNYPNSGYVNGTVSKTNVAFNVNGNPATITAKSGSFDFNSAYLTSAWNNGLNILIEGFSGGTKKYSQTVNVDITSPTLFNFNFLGIDNLKFTSSGGINAPYGDNGKQFVLDNFNYNSKPVPEPLTILGSLTAAGFGVALHRKYKQQQKATSKQI